jgi:prepilin-type processing-associated H-X9-DG protein
MSYAYNTCGCSIQGGYANGFGLGGKEVGGGLTYIRESDVVLPSNTLALGDAIPFFEPRAGVEYASFPFMYPLDTINSGSLAFDLVHANPTSLPILAGVQRRHGGRWNVLFCDQHVENLTTKGLYGVSQDWIARRWNIDQLPHN